MAERYQTGKSQVENDCTTTVRQKTQMSDDKKGR